MDLSDYGKPSGPGRNIPLVGVDLHYAFPRPLVDSNFVISEHGSDMVILPECNQNKNAVRMMCLCSVNSYPIFFFLIFLILLWKEISLVCEGGYFTQVGCEAVQSKGLMQFVAKNSRHH